jgi:hypothetical protein
MPCHLAPLKEKVAPLDGCACKVCKWLRGEPPDEAVNDDAGTRGDRAARVLAA